MDQLLLVVVFFYFLLSVVAIDRDCSTDIIDDGIDDDDVNGRTRVCCMKDGVERRSIDTRVAVVADTTCSDDCRNEVCVLFFDCFVVCLPMDGRICWNGSLVKRKKQLLLLLDLY